MYDPGVWRSYLLMLLGTVACGACATPLETFFCGSSSDCVRNGEVGECGTEQLCTFEDSECVSGRRYGEASGNRTNLCTDAPVDAAISDAVSQLDANADATSGVTTCGLIPGATQFSSVIDRRFTGLGSSDDEFVYILAQTPGATEPSVVERRSTQPVAVWEIPLPAGFEEATGLVIADSTLYASTGQGQTASLIYRFDLEGLDTPVTMPFAVASSDGLAFLGGFLYTVGREEGSVVVHKVNPVTGAASVAFTVTGDVEVHGLDSDGESLLYTSVASGCSIDCLVTLHVVDASGTELCRDDLPGVEIGAGIAVNGQGIWIVDGEALVQLYNRF